MAGWRDRPRPAFRQAAVAELHDTCLCAHIGAPLAGERPLRDGVASTPQGAMLDGSRPTEA